jgi:5-methylcytosine-specific restriction endonuclease McrA
MTKPQTTANRSGLLTTQLKAIRRMADGIVAEKICTKCGESKPVTEFHKKSVASGRLMGPCKVCRSIQGKAYVSANREKENERHRKWREKNPGKSAEYTQRWRDNNPDKYREVTKRANEKGVERVKAWNEANRDKLVAYTQRWRKANPEKYEALIEASKGKFAEYRKKWKRANPELVRAQVHIRRARKVGNGGDHTGEELAQLLESQGHCCANPYCRSDLKIQKKELDHKVPLASGGTSHIENLQWLCAPCNRRKHAKPMDEWLAAEERRSRKAA